MKILDRFRNKQKGASAYNITTYEGKVVGLVPASDENFIRPDKFVIDAASDTLRDHLVEPGEICRFEIDLPVPRTLCVKDLEVTLIKQDYPKKIDLHAKRELTIFYGSNDSVKTYTTDGFDDCLSPPYLEKFGKGVKE